MQLRPAQIDMFNRDGFVTTGELTTPAELERLRGEYERLLATPFGEYHGADDAIVTSEVRIFEDTHPELNASELVQNARAVAAQVTGEDPDDLFWWGQLIHKP